MSRLIESLSKSSVFRNFVSGPHSALTIKDNSQIYVAFQNVIKAINIHGDSTSRVLNADSAKFLVEGLVLNHDSSLLASVGSNSVYVYDIKSTQHLVGKGLYSSHVFACLPETQSTIKSVLWHPASGSNSELVILTEDKILLYDLVVSKTVPVLAIDLEKYPELKKEGVSSIAFGSSTHFAGSITLYLSAKDGNVYAIYPFLYLGAKIWATKAAALRYVSEWDATMDSIDGFLPDSSDFQEARHPLNHQAKFVGSIRQQLEAPLCSEALDTQGFSWAPNFHVIDYKLAGPLAFTGPNAKILEVSSNEKFPCLVVAFEEKGGNTGIKTFAQIDPIVLSFNTASINEPLPVAPPAAPEPEKIIYKKTKKGFGYEEVVDFDSKAKLSSYKAQIKVYKSQLFAHKIKTAYYQYACKHFNKLSVLTNDSLQFPFNESAASSFKLIEKSIFVLNMSGQLLIGDASSLTLQVQSEYQANLEITYKQKNLPKISSIYHYDFAYIDDVIEGTGGYVVAFMPKAPVLVIQLRPKPLKIEPLIIMSRQSEPEKKLNSPEPTPLKVDALPSEDLKLIYSGINTAARPRPIDFSGDFLQPAFNLTSDFITKIGKSTQYFIAVQIKLGLQLDNLKSQIKILEGLPTCQKDKISKIDEKIDILVKRQNSMLKRLEDVRLSIIEKFEACKSKHTLPLSEEERSWFHELNAITKKVALDDGQTPSLGSRVEALKEKVRKVSNKDKTHDEDEAIEESLSKLRLGASLYNINNTLEREQKRVQGIKDTIEGLIIKVHDAGLST